MELERKVIKIDNRNFTFFGTVGEDKMMTVSHIVDVSRAAMFMFYHPELMGKRAEAPFEMPVRTKALAAAKRKFGIAKARCFVNYECVMNTVADADGDNAIDIVDRNQNRSVLLPFIKQHWDIVI